MENESVSYKENNKSSDPENEIKKQLFSACLSGKLETLKHLLDQGVSLEWMDENNQTVLHIACQEGHLDIVNFLIGLGEDAQVTKPFFGWGVNIEAKTKSKKTPLHIACINGQSGIVKLLIECQANLEAKDEWNWTPLHWACWNGHDGIVNALLDAGAQINAKSFALGENNPLRRDFFLMDHDFISTGLYIGSFFLGAPMFYSLWKYVNCKDYLFPNGAKPIEVAFMNQNMNVVKILWPRLSNQDQVEIYHYAKDRQYLNQVWLNIVDWIDCENSKQIEELITDFEIMDISNQADSEMIENAEEQKSVKNNSDLVIVPSNSNLMEKFGIHQSRDLNNSNDEMIGEFIKLEL